MTDREIRLAIIIPALNEEPTIRKVVEASLLHVQRVIVVNDGSTDNTARQLQGLPVEFLSNAMNEGKAFSLWRGFQHLLGSDIDGALTLDGDGQHAPEDIPQFLEAHRKFPKRLIVGLRRERESSAPRLRFLANQFANFWVSWAAGRRIPDSQCGFRIYPMELIRKLRDRSTEYKGFVFESEVLIDATRLGFEIMSVPVETIYLEGRRKSHFRPGLDTLKIARMIAGKLFSSCWNLRGLAKYIRQAAQVEGKLR